MEGVEKFSKRFETSQFVTVHIENTDRTFYLPPGLLCHASPYFEKALNSGFQESKHQTLHLPGCDLQTFELFLYWLCNQQLPDVETEKAFQSILVRLWSFADRHLLPKLQNQTMQKLLTKLYGNVVEMQAVCLAFELNPTGSILRKAMIEEAVHDYGKHRSHSVQNMDLLGTMPGCMTEFIESMRLSFTDPDWARPSERVILNKSSVFTVSEG